MELWRELLLNGLQNDSCEFDYINDTVLKEIIEGSCYQVLLQIKQTLNDENLLDKDCFMKIEAILSTLEANKIFCNRHDYS